MNRYYRAYPVNDLSRFPGWLSGTGEAASAGDEDAVVYVRDDYAVVATPIGPDPRVVFQDPSTEWRDFCRSELGFVPLTDDAEAP